MTVPAQRVAVLESVREICAISFGVPSGSEVDPDAALSSYGFGMFQLDLVEIILQVEQQFEVQIDDDDWAQTSTPNWEQCTASSITQIVLRKLDVGESPLATPALDDTHLSPISLDSAKVAFRAVLGIPPPPNADPTPSQTFHHIGQQHLRSQNWMGATTAFELALSVLRDPEDLPALARDLAQLYRDMGLFVRVHGPELRLKNYKRLVDLVSAFPTRDDALLADAAAVLAHIEWSAGRKDRAVELLDQAIASDAADHPGLLQYICDRANWAFELDDFARGERLLEQAGEMAQARFAAQPETLADFYDQIGQRYADQHNYDRGEAAFDRAIALYREAGLVREEAMAGFRLAMLCARRKDFRRALDLLLRAQNLMIGVVLSPEEIEAVKAKSERFEDRNDLVRASALKDADARAILEALAKTYHFTGPPGHTMQTYRRAISVYEEVYGPEDARTAQLVSHLDALQVAVSGEDRGSVERMEAAVRVLENDPETDGEALAAELAHLAGAYRQLGGRDEQARAAFAQCVELYGGHSDKPQPRAQMALRQLAYTEADLGHVERAVPLLARATELEQKDLAAALARGTEHEKWLFAENVWSRACATLAFHAQHAPADIAMCRLAATALVTSRARVLDAMGDALVMLRRYGQTEDFALVEQWAALLGAEAQWYGESTQVTSDAGSTHPRLDAEFTRIRKQREAIERAIAIKIRDLNAAKPAVALEDVQSRLPIDAVLVEFIELRSVDFRDLRFGERDDSDTHFAAYIIHSNGYPHFVDLGQASVINQCVEALRECLYAGVEAWRKVARELDIRLLEPLKDSIGVSKHLILVPDGELLRVPFCALVDANGNYEIEHFLFTYLTTGRDLAESQNVREDGSPPLILAGPDYGAAKDAVEGLCARLMKREHVMHFEALPDAAREGSMVQKLVPGAELKTGPDASKAALFSAKGPELLHLATHGFYAPDFRSDRDRWADQRLDELAMAYRGEKLEVVPAPSEMLRVGIALQGANHGWDGLLCGLEACALDLRGTRLVVLSACETGLGDISSGEGVSGFRRSFFLAGAQSLVVSLFPIPDAATSSLMERFYKALMRGAGRGRALRDAQLAMLREVKTSHPINWAAFVLLGDWREMKPANLPTDADERIGAGASDAIRRPWDLARRALRRAFAKGDGR